MALLVKLEKYLYDYQFGFKPKHSTDLCIYTLTEVIEFYKSQSSSVYICFMDASKAFDRVNHGTLFKRRIDRGMPDVFVRLLVYWYRTQNGCVRWGTFYSEMYTVSNGVLQGGKLSPLFFNVYTDGLSDILCRTECGYTMGGRMINHYVCGRSCNFESFSQMATTASRHMCCLWRYIQFNSALFSDTPIGKAGQSGPRR